MDKLNQYLAPYSNRPVLLAFSGGVDSALLLHYALKNQLQLLAVTFDNGFQSTEELSMAQKIANDYNARWKLLKIEVLKLPELRFNPLNRCYLCKKILFSQLKDLAAAEKCIAVFDGTNFDDLSEYRPGLQALKELDIKSPLAELKITKQEVRSLAAASGISTAKRPSSPCLATRFEHGAEITTELLQKIEACENLLKTHGFPIVRARVHNNICRIEIPKSQLNELVNADLSGQIIALGFSHAVIDLAGYRLSK